MKKSLNVKSIVVLTAICGVISLLLAATNALTAPIIEKNQNAAANEALLVVMPEGTGFEKMDLSAYELPATVTEAYKEAGGGHVVKLTTTGYGSGFVIMCGVNADGTVSGAVCLSSNETLGYEKTFGENFTGKSSDGIETVDVISGATKTTVAYRNAVKDAINAATILGGGSVDIRSEEEILMDNLSAALPAGEGKFTKLFLTEVIEGIDAVYIADNGKGAVCVIGEQFVGVDASGAVVSGAEGDTAANVSAQMAILNASVETEIDLNVYADLPSALVSATKTESGNYVLEMKGAGYGINGGDDYHPASGEYIFIKVSMTKEGKIIDCLTLSQAETPNIGDACANEAFYGQFVGKTEADYDAVDGISGATLTTNGYKKAILRAFESVKILEGGAGNEE
ncbi:MAG: FMN-binding protein [Lachnospiraceae bacterium]|nr:FMN-binding protein [Lachnospiraceae bacterium]